MNIIPTLDDEACNMIRELCEACGLAIDRIAKQKNLPRQALARLFGTTFEMILDMVEEDE